ncbi:mitochondrial inner membrane protease subunit 2 [Endogone sp. FLAS-F59071]|nr:mitochondrial inner membrane protease subunit 2 [Endogone sp. FLAS-F59071]|eukprot:RUS21286.1 mitochondrial inner membrane protease subunit 2 [Endogone sp. FLAS-F59071]
MSFSKLWSSPTTRTVLRTLTWIPVFVFFIDHCYSFASVEGRSMQPTFNPDSNMLARDIVLLNRWLVMSHRFYHGEVVTMWSPRNPDLMITKRIIALEGDTVKTLKPYPEKLVHIPKGHMWVEGDEAFHSRDSNTFGSVPLGLINAKVTFILWPLSRFGPVARVVKPDRVIFSPASKNSFNEDPDLWL